MRLICGTGNSSHHWDVTAVLVNNKHGIQRREQDFNKRKFVFEGVHSKQVDRRISWEKLTKRGVNKLLKKLRDTGTVDRRPVSSRSRSARTEENVETVNDLVLSQEDKLQTHRTVREISLETGIHQSSVFRIICKDLRLKCFKRRRAQELTDAVLLAWSALSFCFRTSRSLPLTLYSSRTKRCSRSLHLTIGRWSVHSKCNLFAFSSITAEYMHKIWMLPWAVQNCVLF